MTTADVWTIAMAGAALALSVVSLVWQVVRARYERPVLHVMAGATCTGTGDGSLSLAWEPWVSVTNVGEKPVTLTSLLFKIEAKSSELDGDMTWVWDAPPTAAKDSPAVPMRLEGYDHAIWWFGPTTISALPDEVTGWAEVSFVTRRKRRDDHGDWTHVEVHKTVAEQFEGHL